MSRMIVSLPRIIEPVPRGADELLLVNLHTLETVRLNRTGAMIVRIAGSGLTLQEVVDEFSQATGSRHEEAGPVVCDYLNHLIGGGWLLDQGRVPISP